MFFVYIDVPPLFITQIVFSYQVPFTEIFDKGIRNCIKSMDMNFSNAIIIFVEACNGMMAKRRVYINMIYTC